MDVLIAIYREIHPPLVTLLCVAGTVGHILSMATLASMLNPTNLLLISMSGSQLVFCVNYLYTILFKFGTETLCLTPLWGWGWTASFLVSVNLSVMVHMTGVFHVVALSIVRYFSLKHISKVSSTLPWFTYQKSVISLVVIYMSMLIVCGPIYFNSEIREVPYHETCVSKFPALNGTVAYELHVRNKVLQQVIFWLFGSICKLIPCMVLFVMTFFILDRLKLIRQMNERFGNHERDRRYDRTTKMILIIMLIFIVVEFPQGIMAVLHSMVDLPAGAQEFGDLFEMLTLLTSCIIFALLCSMNSSLRNELYQLFCRRFQRWSDERKHRRKNANCVELAYLVNGADKNAVRATPRCSMERN